MPCVRKAAPMRLACSTPREERFTSCAQLPGARCPIPSWMSTCVWRNKITLPPCFNAAQTCSSSACKGLRGAINPIVDRLWHEKITTEPFTASSEGEKLYLAVLSLSPQNETQRSLQARAVQIANNLVQTRLLLFVETENQIPIPFLAILVFWLFNIFELQFIFGSQCNSFGFSLRLWLIGLVCNLFDFRT